MILKSREQKGELVDRILELDIDRETLSERRQS